MRLRVHILVHVDVCLCVCVSVCVCVCVCVCVSYEDGFVVGRAESSSLELKRQPMEEENERLREAVSDLRSAVRTERGRREGVEKECHALLGEFSRLEARVQVGINQSDDTIEYD